MKLDVTFNNGVWTAESHCFSNYACCSSEDLGEAINNAVLESGVDSSLGSVRVCFRYADIERVLLGFSPLNVSVLSEKCSEGGDQ